MQYAHVRTVGQERRRQVRIARRRAERGDAPAMVRLPSESAPKLSRPALKDRATAFLLAWWARIDAAKRRVSLNGRCEFQRVTRDEKTKRFRIGGVCGGALRPVKAWVGEVHVTSLRCQACGRTSAAR